MTCESGVLGSSWQLEIVVIRTSCELSVGWFAAAALNAGAA